MDFDPQAIRAFEHDAWQRVAVRYGGTFAAATTIFVDALLDAAGVGAQTRVLDVCCGPGYVAGAAAARGAVAAGLDFSTAMLDIARAAHPRVDFTQGDAEALPFPAASFGAAVSNFGIHHVPHPAAALAEMRRVLTPGGRAAFTTWPRPDSNPPWQLLFDAIRRHGDLSAAQAPPPSGSINGEEACRSALETAGFGGIETRVVRREWPVGSAHDLVAALANGTARTAALIHAQDAAALPLIEVHMAEHAERYRRGGELRIPIAAILAWGVKQESVISNQ
jgi:SAM-dependent methyltransferase